MKAAIAGVLGLILAHPAGAQTVDEAVWRGVSATTPGCAVGATSGDEVVFRDHRGLADLDHGVAIDGDTVFEAGSASKQFTAAAILTLVRDGRLSLDDDIRRHLPELEPLGEAITIDQLLNHTNGLRDWRMIRGLAGWRLGTAVHTNDDALAVAAAQRGLNHAPGAAFSYTNTGYSLLALVVERVSGESLANYSRRVLFEPLGMTRTHWRESFRAVVPDRAVAYGRDGPGGAFYADMPFENAHGAGGLLTTLDDLLTWNRALNDGGLGDEVTRGLEQPARLSDGREVGYGRGLFLRRYRGVREAGHGGVTGGYVSYVARYPDQAVSVAVLCNGSHVNPRLMAETMADRLLRAAPDGETTEAVLTNPPVEERDKPRWRPGADELDRLVGRYRSDEIGADYRIELRDGQPWLALVGVPGLERRLSPLHAGELVFLGGVVQTMETDGKVAGFTLSVDRALGLRFDRVD